MAADARPQAENNAVAIRCFHMSRPLVGLEEIRCAGYPDLERRRLRVSHIDEAALQYPRYSMMPCRFGLHHGCGNGDSFHDASILAVIVIESQDPNSWTFIQPLPLFSGVGSSTKRISASRRLSSPVARTKPTGGIVGRWPWSHPRVNLAYRPTHRCVAMLCSESAFGQEQFVNLDFSWT